MPDGSLACSAATDLGAVLSAALGAEPDDFALVFLTAAVFADESADDAFVVFAAGFVAVFAVLAVAAALVRGVLTLSVSGEVVSVWSS
jgi:hypothetical protein